MKSGAFFPKENFVFWCGLRPKPNLPRPWANPMIERVKKWWDGKLYGLIENIYTPVTVRAGKIFLFLGGGGGCRRREKSFSLHTLWFKNYLENKLIKCKLILLSLMDYHARYVIYFVKNRTHWTYEIFI